MIIITHIRILTLSHNTNELLQWNSVMFFSNDMIQNIQIGTYSVQRMYHIIQQITVRYVIMLIVLKLKKIYFCILNIHTYFTYSDKGSNDLFAILCFDKFFFTLFIYFKSSKSKQVYIVPQPGLPSLKLFPYLTKYINTGFCLRLHSIHNNMWHPFFAGGCRPLSNLDMLRPTGPHLMRSGHNRKILYLCWNYAPYATEKLIIGIYDIIWLACWSSG